MSFLNASLLWPLLPLVGLPILIHWLSRRFPKKFHFSSIEDIRRTLAGRSRLFRWRHRLLLLLRTLALLALLIAFLKPMLARRHDPAGKKRHVILLIDHSLSMTHAEDGASALAKAHAEAGRLLDSFDADDRFNLILAGPAPLTAFPDFTTDRQSALAFLRGLKPPFGNADFQAANQLAARLAKDAGGSADLYYFSDFQRRDWATVNFDSLPAGTRLFFIDAASTPHRSNQAITRLDLTPSAVIAGGEVELVARIANFSPDPWQGKIEAGFGPAALREKETLLPPWSEADVTLVLPVPAGGLLPLQASIGGDALPADNHRHLVVQVQEREEVILLAGSDEDAARLSPTLFLKTAVDPYESDKSSYLPRLLQPAGLRPSALAASGRLIATRLPALDDEKLGAIAGFLHGGGGMVWFLDGEVDAANLEKLASITGETLPIRLAGRLDSTHLPDGAMRVASGDFQSRFLRLFEGERRQNLALLEFYDLHHAVPTGSGKTLLTYADGTPAMTEKQIGLGTLLLCNFSVAEASSNLARQRLFPAWIQEMLLRMHPSNSAAMEPFLTGETIAGETWAAEAAGRDLTDPAGHPLRPRTEITGERMRIRFSPDTPGIYRMDAGGGRTLLAFAVNPDTGQSDLRSIDPAVLPDRVGDKHPQASFAGASADYRTLLRGRPLYHGFILAALTLLLAEALLFKSPPRPSTPADS